MTEYGYIEDGYLRAIEIKPTIYNRKREDGTVEAVEVSVEEIGRASCRERVWQLV